MTIESNNRQTVVVIGSGEIYFDRFDADGNLTGEEYIGDSSEMSLTTNTEFNVVQSSDGPVSRVLLNKPRSITRTGSFVTRDMTMENWARWAGGAEPTTVVQAADPVIDEEIVAKQGRWFALGGGDSLLALSDVAVVVKTALDAVIDQPDNYSISKENGRIYISPEGAIADAATIKVSYTPKAQTLKVASAGELLIISGAIRYIESANIEGHRRNFYIPNAIISPSGDTALKSGDSEQLISMTFTMQPRGTDGKSLIIDGVAQ